MNITTLTERLRAIKIVPVIALDNAADAVPLGAALRESGIPVAEITFRSPAAAEAIRRLRDADPDILIAAGTVLNAAQAKAAQQAGADFIVSPGFNPNTVKACQDMDIPITPGINNPTAIEAALEHGIDTVKYFPAEASGGIPMLKALLAPYAMLKIMPTGGINAKNIRDYLAIKNVIACGGSWMVEKSLLAAQNWAEVERLGKEAVALVQE
ncbi:bifunctional 4-hydroxy-2-oxoglutarate aldolase/2-dehydro-3-deoxy-phosphogluconate aldolase [Cardiobacterium valvarum]|uniref:2-dehydro-3-deoxy-phosphogluconate aldolase n=1 Tax=Cardiobacterium valvarum F0432 TaxID=797473 RepID=G9ZH09_9GAMM|nr:bifunctional 4-hydroxy-2-oxoglutarate aldolase/2-dehydro-3-deoxy-phosphogluconate aldolase [Cardiobacterium valvarum]EHM52850.1 putative KHG/KDPG aldolase [Cardiobacterium valvarum F0432]